LILFSNQIVALGFLNFSSIAGYQIWAKPYPYHWGHQCPP